MSDEGKKRSAAQDTGNPVLDSLINLMSGFSPKPDNLKLVHATLLELAAKEPGGLKRSKDNISV